MPAPRVLLDANVLIPLNPRDVILAAANTPAPLCRVFWTETILAETERNFPKAIRRGDAAEKAVRATALVTELRTTFPDALIAGYEPLIEQMQTTDPEDRHVAAAAAYAQVDAIVTFNVRHYPPITFDAMPLHPQVLTPDVFLMQLFGIAPTVLHARLQVQEMRGKAYDPDVTVRRILERMAPRLPQFVDAMIAWVDEQVRAEED
ncbi:MAG: PIN domain-containing protein [Chloroflexota bacterium]|nr:PIN domain-containing protein [Chloroflexota bacterium]